MAQFGVAENDPVETMHLVLSSACGTVARSGALILSIGQKTVSPEYPVPHEAVFIMVHTSDLTGDPQPNIFMLEQPYNFLGFWARGIHANLAGSAPLNFVQTRLQYGNPAQNWCSNVFVILDHTLGADPRMCLDFSSVKEETLNLGNVVIKVRNTSGVIDNIVWDHDAIRQKRIAWYGYTGPNMKKVQRLMPQSKLNVSMSQAENFKNLRLSWTFNDARCEASSFAITRSSVFEVWVHENERETLIFKILFQ